MIDSSKMAFGKESSNGILPVTSRASEVIHRHLHSRTWSNMLFDACLMAGGMFGVYSIMRKILVNLDPTSKRGSLDPIVVLKKRIVESLKKSGRSLSNLKEFRTNKYEDALLDTVKLPSQLTVSFDDIGGLEEQKQSIMETILLPLGCPELFSDRSDNFSDLCRPPTGILFYGPPGTGKTMTAKAIAKTARSTFMDIKMSKITSKWYGETGKYVCAVFSLARKLAPTILFIDEVDGFLGIRGKFSEHAVDSQIKALFLSIWDGLDLTNGVIVLGATNRPFDIDPAVLRRLPRQYKFPIPDEPSRLKILRKILPRISLDQSVDINELAKLTADYTGSDLKEVCKVAASFVMQDYVRKKFSSELKGKIVVIGDIGRQVQPKLPQKLRKITQADLKKAINKVKPPTRKAYAYQSELKTSELMNRFKAMRKSPTNNPEDNTTSDLQPPQVPGPD
jgi:SpoVK/Ycf46/Vps4 family AAA+-type ATPase